MSTQIMKVADMAKQLGTTDKEVIARAAEAGIKLNTFSQIDLATQMRLRTLFRTGARPGAATSGAAPASAAPAARPNPAAPAARPTTSAKPATRSAAVAPAAPAAPPPVVRRRAANEAPEIPQREAVPEVPRIEARTEPAPRTEPAAPPAEVVEQSIAPVTQAPQEEAPAEFTPREEVVVVPAVTAQPQVSEPVARTTAPAGRTTIRRARLEDLEVPNEFKLRVSEPAPVVVEPEVVIADDIGPDDTEVAVAPVAPRAEAPRAPVGPTGRQIVEVANIDPRRATLTLQQIGGPIEGGAASTSTARRPTIVRHKMPEELLNPVKPAPRPVAAAVPAVEVVRQPVGPGTEPPGGRGVVADPRGDAGKGGRGRKVIYERHKDAQADGRVRGKKKGGKGAKAAPVVPMLTKAEKRHLRIEDTITVANLAHQLSVKSTEVIRKLFSLGQMATINQPLDMDTVELVASEFGFTVENVGFDLDTYLQSAEEAPGHLVQRSPVVTVMGHVDHGKTSLLDAIRKTHSAAKEAGGITQHIGAYVATVPAAYFADGADRRVVFLDTPGHEAFSAMRARGAKATDVIVLVVAADDGVMPQTIEAINHAKAAKVPMIVAVNKIDKPGADLDKVRRELAEHGVMAEEWGGDTTFVEVSAKTGKGLERLLEMLALQSDIMELTANPDCDARGLVIESRLEKGRGPVATLLVQAGTLRRGQILVCGSQYCKVRAMLSDQGKPLDIAGPSTPVEVIGFDTVTNAGDEFYIVADEKKAKAIVEHRIEKVREKELLKTSRRTLEEMFQQHAQGEVKELNLIIKADVHGSAEALKAALSKIEHEEVKVRVLHSMVGGVTESDINLAATAKGYIIAFNVKPEAKGKRLADDMGVAIKQYSVIYDAIDEVTALLEGMLTPIIEEHVLGHAEVRQIFQVPKLGTIAGCNVTDGVMQRSQRLRVLRGKEILHDGDFASLRRFKDDVREVQNGYDCGVGVTNFTKFNVGDIIECYELKKIARKLKPEDKQGGRSQPAA